MDIIFDSLSKPLIKKYAQFGVIHKKTTSTHMYFDVPKDWLDDNKRKIVDLDHVLQNMLNKKLKYKII